MIIVKKLREKIKTRRMDSLH